MSLLFSALSLGVVVAGLAFIVAILPTSPILPTEFIDSIVSLVNYIEPWGYLVNYTALLAVAAFVTVFEFIILAIRVVLWVFSRIFNRS